MKSQKLPLFTSSPFRSRRAVGARLMAVLATAIWTPINSFASDSIALNYDDLASTFTLEGKTIQPHAPLHFRGRSAYLDSVKSWPDLNTQEWHQVKDTSIHATVRKNGQRVHEFFGHPGNEVTPDQVRTMSFDGLAKWEEGVVVGTPLPFDVTEGSYDVDFKMPKDSDGFASIHFDVVKWTSPNPLDAGEPKYFLKADWENFALMKGSQPDERVEMGLYLNSREVPEKRQLTVLATLNKDRKPIAQWGTIDPQVKGVVVSVDPSYSLYSQRWIKLKDKSSEMELKDFADGVYSIDITINGTPRGVATFQVKNGYFALGDRQNPSVNQNSKQSIYSANKLYWFEIAPRK